MFFCPAVYAWDVSFFPGPGTIAPYSVTGKEVRSRMDKNCKNGQDKNNQDKNNSQNTNQNKNCK